VKKHINGLPFVFGISRSKKYLDMLEKNRMVEEREMLGILRKHNTPSLGGLSLC
jgi:hypothetical protein